MRQWLEVRWLNLSHHSLRVTTAISSLTLEINNVAATYKYKTIYKLLITQMYRLNNKIYAILICCVGQRMENITIHVVLKHMLLLCDQASIKLRRTCFIRNLSIWRASIKTGLMRFLRFILVSALEEKMRSHGMEEA